MKKDHFYQYFEIFLILAQNAESEKHFRIQHFIVYGNRKNRF